MSHWLWKRTATSNMILSHQPKLQPMHPIMGERYTVREANRYQTCTHTHTRLTALFPGLPRWAGTRKVKTNYWSKRQWVAWHQLGHMQVCTLLQTDTMPAPHHSVFTGRMPFLPPNQQRQSTEGWISDMHHRCNLLIGQFWLSVFYWCFRTKAELHRAVYGEQ